MEFLLKSVDKLLYSLKEGASTGAPELMPEGGDSEPSVATKAFTLESFLEDLLQDQATHLKAQIWALESAQFYGLKPKVNIDKFYDSF